MSCYVENGRKGLDFSNEEASFGVAGEATDSEIEPRFGVDRLASECAVFAALEPELDVGMRTWKSDICFTTRILPESKHELMVM